MKISALPIVLLLFTSIGPSLFATDDYRYQLTMDKLASSNSELGRFYALRDAAKGSVLAGQNEVAKKLASELLELAKKFQQNDHYGDAIHDGYMVLGQVAVREDKLDEAKKYLTEAAQTPGSPRLNSFGPNMGLAKDLLEKGEREAVLEYFKLCGNFWKLPLSHLQQWAAEVQSGQVPDFGANLNY